MRVVILSFLVCLPLLDGQAQERLPGSLWKAVMVYDTLGNKYPKENIQKFMYFENEHEVSTLTIYEKINMSNGEVIISYLVEANNLEQKTKAGYKVKEYKVDSLTVVTEDSIYYAERFFGVGYERIDIGQSSVTKSELLDFLYDRPVIKYYGNGESLNQIHTYRRNGRKAIKIIDSPSEWESDFRVICFEGYLFLKGITSPPMIIEKKEGGAIIGAEADRRFGLRRFEMKEKEH